MLKKLKITGTYTAIGEETIKEYHKSVQMKDVFDLLILDLTIPGGLGGKDTLQQILEIDPDAYAIVSSGYAHEKDEQLQGLWVFQCFGQTLSISRFTRNLGILHCEQVISLKKT